MAKHDKWRECFGVADADGDGRLNKQEFMVFRRALLDYEKE